LPSQLSALARRQLSLLGGAIGASIPSIRNQVLKEIIEVHDVTNVSTAAVETSTSCRLTFSDVNESRQRANADTGVVLLHFLTSESSP
jgi:hypothetical protein